MTSLSGLAQEQIASLHRQCIDDAREIRRVLETARREKARLHAGVSRVAAARWCHIVVVRGSRLILRCANFSPAATRHYYFTLRCAGDEYFFASLLRSTRGHLLEFDLPGAIYRTERREAQRVCPELLGLERSATILLEGAAPVVISDVSRGGVGLILQEGEPASFPDRFELEVCRVRGPRARLYAEVRNVRQEGGSWSRLGLSVSTVANCRAGVEERREPLHERDGSWKRISVAGHVAATAVDRVLRRINPSRPLWSSQVVRFRNQLDQEMVGLVNSSGGTKGAPAVVIPPAWGKTKETLLPLALTIVETCLRYGLPITVLRFDGTNRRGESFVNAACRAPGAEYRRFRFSQAVQDLRSALSFLRDDPSFAAPSSVIVSFSLSAIEARRAVATSPDHVAGWIPVVGMVDLQSGLRAVSGGVDYAEGLLKGISFGQHELVGVLADMDFTGRDALEADLVFKEDARRDMAQIAVPVTWIHGEHDAWMDVERVRDLLAAGTAENRRLIQVPTGHQLRTSREALRTFELIASEVVRMLWGRNVDATSPALREIDRARAAERRRLRPAAPVNLRGFWTDYLLGRHRLIGMDLLTATSTYRDLMRSQVAALRLDPSDRVLDLGSGTGGLLRELVGASIQPKHVIAVDLVAGALKRARGCDVGRIRRSFVQVDLDQAAIPCGDASVDAVLASLLVSYVRNPLELLVEVRRVLRPGGRLVISSLRRDADISSIYAEGVAELVAAGAERAVAGEGLSFAEVQRSFLNEAARLLDLEEQGFFKFYDGSELAALVRRAGFSVVANQEALGDPAQAVVVVATRRHS